MYARLVFVYFASLFLVACGGGGNGGSGGNGTDINVEESNDYSYITEPQLVSSFQLTNGAQLLTLSRSGDLLYVGNTDGLYVFDVSDPSKPVERYFMETPDLVRGFELSKNGQLGYLSGGDYLSVISLENKEAPLILNSLDLMDYRVSNLALLSDGETVVLNDLKFPLIDVSNPSELTMLNELEWGSRISVYSDLDIAYIASVGQSILIVDLSDPMNPEYLNEIEDATFRFLCFSPSGDFGYIIDHDEFVIFDSSNLREPDIVNGYRENILGTTFVRELARDIKLSKSENYAYVADGFEGVSFIDIRDKSNPSNTMAVNTNNDAFSILASADGDFLFVADKDFGLQVIYLPPNYR